MVGKFGQRLLNVVALAATFTTFGGAQPRAPLTHHVREVTRTGDAKLVGQMPPSQIMTLDLVLPLGEQAGLDAFLKDIYNPYSPNFHNYVTPAEFTQRFGPSQENYDALVNFAKTNGFTIVGGSRDSMDLVVTGAVSTIQNAFHVTVGSYQHPTESRTFYAPDREPTVDLPFALWHISGLDNYSIPKPHLVSRQDYAQAHPDALISNATTGSGPSASFLGSDMRAAYYGSGSLNGAGQNLGLLEFRGTDLADLTTYFSNIGQTNNVPITLLSTDGTSTSCVYSGKNKCDDTEQTLDMTQALGLAPGLASLVVYVGSSDTAMIGAMTTHNPLPLTIGCSWGWTPVDPTTLNPYFEKLAAQGQTFLTASGDSSTWSSSVQPWPADADYVVAVGGTDLSTSGPAGSWLSETAWLDSGGGVSPNSIPIPSWQQIAGVINSSNQGSTTLRNGPDVSANANFTYYVCANQTTCTANHWGGTSFAAPLWAGFLALANQQSAASGGKPVGFINPTIYAQNVTASYGINFHDITTGTSGSYSAVTGYDLVTGWGSPNGTAIINGLLGIQSITFGPIATQTVGIPLTLTATASSGLPVSYSSSTTSVCTVSGNTATFLAAGTCSITASQAGTTTFSAATPVTQSFTVNAGTISSSATYQGADTSTEGTWTNVYGSDGNLIANNPATAPSYATVSVSGDYTYTWYPSTSDSRALQTSSGATTRIASQYFSTGSFNINVRLTDGNTRRVALYLLDFDNANRAETITIKDAVSGATLDTESYSNFQNGVWAVWNIKGNVVIQVTTTGGPNATVSGIFFGTPSSATYTGADSSTQGTWTNVYGTDGNLIANNPAAPPSYATVSVTGDYTYSWSPSTSDARALQTSSGATTRIASQYFSPTSFNINVNINDGNTHRIALYLLDWDLTGRAERITVKDAVSGAVLDTENYSNFQSGVWAVWNIKGNVVIQVTTTGGPNATVSGIFFGAAPAATYTGANTSAQGTWTNVYGTAGYLIAAGASALPSYANISVTGDYSYTWSQSTTDTRALQTSPGATTRIAAQYFSTSSFNINVDLTDGNTHQVALYLLDYDNANRAESITIKDAVSGAVLDTENYSNFQSGVWAVWNLKGNVVIQVTTTGGPNATISGIFLGTPATATYLGADTATEGTWTSVYGNAGYLIAAGTTALPSYATVNVSGDYSYTWSSSTSDTRALQTSSGATTRVAAQDFSTTSFNINVNLTDGNTHQVALYLLDFDFANRAESITIKDAISGAVLDTENYSNFQNGIWAVWNLRGNVVIQLTTTGGPNATVSGIFFN